jgi:hypothetical protein
MRPLGPLKEAQIAFENFRESTQTVTSESVQVTKYVRFENGCEDEARETLDGYKVWYELADQQYEYFFVRVVVPGPITDGNNIQMIDDCKIFTVTKLEPYIEGETNRIKMASEKNENTATAQLATVSEPVQIKAGCHSDGPNHLLMLMVVVVLAKKMKNLIRF